MEEPEPDPDCAAREALYEEPGIEAGIVAYAFETYALDLVFPCTPSTPSCEISAFWLLHRPLAELPADEAAAREAAVDLLGDVGDARWVEEGEAERLALAPGPQLVCGRFGDDDPHLEPLWWHCAAVNLPPDTVLWFELGYYTRSAIGAMRAGLDPEDDPFGSPRGIHFIVDIDAVEPAADGDAGVSGDAGNR